MGSVASPAAVPERTAELPTAVNSDEERSLVPAAVAKGPTRPVQLSPLLARVSIELDVVVPIRDFRLRDLLALERGRVIATQWDHGEDLPLASGKVQLAWTEFEVIDTKLAVRITRLA